MRNKKAVAVFATAALASRLLFPSLAFARVSVDAIELEQGNNEVGGGTATLADSTLDMVDVTAGYVVTDEDLTMNFDGGNEIDAVITEESADVEMNFSGDNAVENVYAEDNSEVTINADGNNDFENVIATDNADVTVNVTGENNFDQISGIDNASITIQGTDGQENDVVNLGEGAEYASIYTDNGSLTIDNVTVNMKGERALINSSDGNVTINSSTITSASSNESTYIGAGGEIMVNDSTIDINGSMFSEGEMTIKRSNVAVHTPIVEYGYSSYGIWSLTGINLVDQVSGEVQTLELGDKTIYYIGSSDGSDTAVNTDSDAARYLHEDDFAPKGTGHILAKTSDVRNPMWPLPCGIMFIAAGWLARRRQSEL